jgi:gluconokinase
MPPIAIPRIVVMGVSGVGKTEVGRRLAERLGLPFADADDLHPAANVAKMAAGIPLDDDDRWPWLDAVGAALAGRPLVMACSALRRAYRDRIRAAAPGAVFVEIAVDPAVIRARMDARAGHFMPSSLLDSQLATLEHLAADEAGCVVDGSGAIDAVVEAAAACLTDPAR